MIARFLNESFTVQKLDNPVRAQGIVHKKLEQMLHKKYPEYTMPEYMKYALYRFFNVAYHSVFEAEDKYKKVFFVFGGSWFALGRISYLENDLGLKASYYQEVMAFIYEGTLDPNDKNFYKEKDWNWKFMSLGKMSNHKYLGTKEDIPSMFSNLDVLFKTIAKCGSADAVCDILKKASSGSLAWKPVP